jgi:carboxypeptidase E
MLNNYRAISMAYSLTHPTMGNPKRRSCDPLDRIHFGQTRGIVNGAKWYSVRGGMQDFNYLSSNDFEITLELGCIKYPRAKELEKEWDANRDAMINFMWQVILSIPFGAFI